MLAYDVRGDGAEGVVFLHGFLGSGRNLASLVRRYLETRPDVKVLIPDLTGHGGSVALPPDTDLFTMATDVVACMQDAGLGTKARWIGHSMGGRVALAAAQAVPEHVRDVVLLDIGPSPLDDLHGGLQEVFSLLLRAPAKAASRDTMRAFFCEQGVSRALADWITMNLAFDGDNFIWRLDRAALEPFHRRQVATDLWEAAKLLGPRCLCIKGDSSNFVSPQDESRLRALGARVHGIAGAGHFVHVDNQPALLAILQGEDA